MRMHTHHAGNHSDGPRAVSTARATEELNNAAESLSRGGVITGVAVILLLSLLMLIALMQPASAAGNGWFTQAQATRGHQMFNNQCAQCHRPDLTGAAGPALVGPAFLAKWGNKPLSDLYTFEHEKMPAINPGSVPPDQLWAITAYILQKNGFAAGSADLGDDASTRVLAK